MTGAARTLVFGAFDRHNLGDMLFAHVVAALAPRRERLVFATPFEDRWEAAGRLLGINLLHLSSAAGHA